MPATKENGLTSWKHIGLFGHSVGMFTISPEGIQWKSALESDSSRRNIPRALIEAAQWSVFGRSGYLRVKTVDNEENNSTNSKLPSELRFDGFPMSTFVCSDGTNMRCGIERFLLFTHNQITIPGLIHSHAPSPPLPARLLLSTDDYDELKDAFLSYYKIDVSILKISSAGTQYGLSKIKNKKLVFRHCTLEDANEEEGEEFEVRQDDEMMSLDLQEVSQCVLPGNNRNEIEIQFPESDAVETSNDQLVSVRFYIPPDPDADPSDKATVTNAEALQQKIMKLARIRKTTGDVLVEFDLEKGSFLTPRGRYSIELCTLTAVRRSVMFLLLID